MLEDMFSSIKSRSGKKHDICDSYDRQICHKIMRKLKKLKDSSSYRQARVAGNGKYNVCHGFEGYIVKHSGEDMYM